MQKQRVQLAESNDHLTQRISQLNIQNNELESRNSKLESEITILDSKHAKNVVEKDSALKQQIKLDNQYEDLEEILRDKNTVLSKISHEKELLKSNINQKTNKIGFIEDDIQEIDNKRVVEDQNLKQVQTKHSRLEQKLITITTELNNQQMDLSQTQSTKNEVDKSIILIETKIKTHKVQMNSTIQNLEFINTDLEQKRKNIITFSENLKDIKDKVSKKKELFRLRTNELAKVLREEVELSSNEKSVGQELKILKEKHKETCFNIEAKEK